jgi:hypothetical protein
VRPAAKPPSRPAAAERAGHKRAAQWELGDSDLSDYVDSDEPEYESDLDGMEASFADIDQEERVSRRAAIREDLEDERREMEELAHARAKRVKAAR